MTGLLIQTDGSQPNWIPEIKKPYWLIATINDATSEVIFDKSYPYEGVFIRIEELRI